MNQLDPLHPAPRDPDYRRPDNGYGYGFRDDEEHLKASLRRLFGHAWETVDKPARTETPETSE